MSGKKKKIEDIEKDTAMSIDVDKIKEMVDGQSESEAILVETMFKIRLMKYAYEAMASCNFENIDMVVVAHSNLALGRAFGMDHMKLMSNALLNIQNVDITHVLDGLVGDTVMTRLKKSWSGRSGWYLSDIIDEYGNDIITYLSAPLVLDPNDEKLYESKSLLDKHRMFMKEAYEAEKMAVKLYLHIL